MFITFIFKLLQVADQTTDDVNKLHAKIERKQHVEKTNEEMCKELQKVSQEHCLRLTDFITDETKEKFKKYRALEDDQGKFILYCISKYFLDF